MCCSFSAYFYFVFIRSVSVHVNNPHLNGYDMASLVKACPSLKPYIITSKQGRETINFSDEQGVKALNKALLIHHYQLQFWDIPNGYLCPPIPGRADYLLALNDVIRSQSEFKHSKSEQVNALDIGTGANLIYPIVGHQLLNWQFVAADIDADSIKNAQLIIDKNPVLSSGIELRTQVNDQHIFSGIINSNDYFDVTCCNPPFHKSAEEAMAGSIRKNKNLTRNKKKRQSQCKSNPTNTHLNFAGKSNELWCNGGELAFVKNMITESKQVANQVGVFSCLISKKENLPPLKAALKSIKVRKYDVYDMQQGNKVSRFIYWSF